MRLITTGIFGMLLLMQVLLAAAPGRGPTVLCLPIGACSGHDSEVPCQSDCCEHAHDLAGEHHHACVPNPLEHDRQNSPPALQRHPRCGCCVHVSLPGDPQTTTDPKSRADDVRTVFVPVLAWIVAAPQQAPVLTGGLRPRPPDWTSSAQVRALKVTRLLT